MFTYSFTRGFGIKVLRGILLPSYRSLNRFLLIGAVSIRRVYKDVIFYMPGPFLTFKFGGLVI
jgi:hypothetical protein